MNELEFEIFSIMTNIELAFQNSGAHKSAKNKFIKEFINKRYKAGGYEKKHFQFMRDRLKYKEPRYAYLWEMHYEQFSINFKMSELLKGKSDIERLSALFEEAKLLGYVVIYGINESYTPNEEEMKKISHKGLIAIHESQLTRVEADGNFPDDNFISISAFGSLTQCQDVMAKLQKYGFGCLPPKYSETNATFIKVRSSAKHGLN